MAFRRSGVRTPSAPPPSGDMNKTFSLTVNGASKSVTTDPERSLLDVLREDLQLTGAKYGCGEGQCRACTVLLDGKAVPACLTAISDADKKSVLTIEGIGKADKLHSVQERSEEHTSELQSP